MAGWPRRAFYRHLPRMGTILCSRRLQAIPLRHRFREQRSTAWLQLKRSLRGRIGELFNEFNRVSDAVLIGLGYAHGSEPALGYLARRDLHGKSGKVADAPQFFQGADGEAGDGCGSSPRSACPLLCTRHTIAANSSTIIARHAAGY